MKKINIKLLLIVTFLLSASLFAQEKAAIISGERFKIVDLKTGSSFTTDSCNIVYDFLVKDNNTYLLSNSYKKCQATESGLQKCNNQLDSGKIIRLETIKKGHFKRIFSSPSGSRVLISEYGKDTDIHYYLFNSRTNKLKLLNSLDGLTILGWYSEDKLIVQKTNRLYLFSIKGISMDGFAPGLFIPNDSYPEVRLVGSGELLLSLFGKDKTKLLVANKNTFVELFRSNSILYDIAKVNSNEIAFIENIAEKGKRKSLLFRLNITGRVIYKKDISDLLKIESPIFSVKMSENILDNNIIISVFDSVFNMDGLYKINIDNPMDNIKITNHHGFNNSRIYLF